MPQTTVHRGSSVAKQQTGESQKAYQYRETGENRAVELGRVLKRWESACKPACLTHLPTSVVRKVVIEFNIAAATGRILVEEAEFLPQFPMFCLSAYNALRKASSSSGSGSRSCSSGSYCTVTLRNLTKISAPYTTPLGDGSQHPKPHPPARISAHTAPRPLDLDKGSTANRATEYRPSITALRYRAPSHASELTTRRQMLAWKTRLVSTRPREPSKERDCIGPANAAPGKYWQLCIGWSSELRSLVPLPSVTYRAALTKHRDPFSVQQARASRPSSPSLPGGSLGSSPNPHYDPDWGFVIPFPPTAADITVPLANTWTRCHPRKPPWSNPRAPVGRVPNGSLQPSSSSKSIVNLATSSGESLEWVKGHGHSHAKTAVRGTQCPSTAPPLSLATNQRLLTPHIWQDSRESGVDELQVAHS
ncbi:hypothetical protein FDECE_2050 [Fusarium decemcellulare]|nr:hypothetical protein FDECE_2050 [Fusarium decemcellulare]